MDENLKRREFRKWLKGKQRKRKKFGGIVESLKYLENNTDITKVITRDGTNKTDGYIFKINDLIMDYRNRVRGINEEIQNRIKEEE